MEQLVRQIGEERSFQEGKHWEELEDGSLIVSFKQWSRPHRHKLGVLLKIKLFFLCILSYFFGREKVFYKFSRWFSRYTCIPIADTQEEFSESQALCGRGAVTAAGRWLGFSGDSLAASGWLHNPSAEGTLSTSCSGTKIPPASGRGPKTNKQKKNSFLLLLSAIMQYIYIWISIFEQTLGDGEGQGSLACCSTLGLQRIGQDWATEHYQSRYPSVYTYYIYKWISVVV